MSSIINLDNYDELKNSMFLPESLHLSKNLDKRNVFIANFVQRFSFS